MQSRCKSLPRTLRPASAAFGFPNPPPSPLRMACRFSVLLLALTLLVGCDRAPLEQVGPELEIVSPDLGLALTGPGLTLQIRARRGEQLESVRVNGVEAERTGDIFFAAVQASEPGLLPLEIVSVGRSGAESVLSDAALYLPYAFGGIAFAETGAVGEHAAVLLASGGVLVSGGVPTPEGDATQAAFIVGSGTAPVPTGDLLDARAGHTMTALPDGRVLVLGGATRAFPPEPDVLGLDDLVSTAEVFDPETGTFLPVALALRDPIQRTQHTAFAVPLVGGGTAVYLTGGAGFAGTRGGEPLFGPISTLRRLRYEPGGPGDGGRLVQDSFDPTDGPRVDYFAGHAESAIEGVPGATVIVGAKDSLNGFVDASYRALYGSQSQDSRLFPLPDPPVVAETRPLVRVDHAGAPGLAGLAVFTGGRRPGDAARTPIATTTVYADAPRKRFVLPESADLQVPRWGHTATSVGAGRILIIGGFDRDGVPAPLVEIFGLR